MPDSYKVNPFTGKLDNVGSYTSPTSVANGGTGLTTIAAGSILAANALDTLTAVTSTTGLKILQNNAGTMSWNTTTGTGNSVMATSPTLVTPLLGTPTSGTLTNCTDVPISTGVSGLGTGVATFLATPSSANLAAAVTNETGSGALVFATSPVLVTPNIGTPSAGTLTSCTGLPISTGVSGLGTGVATFLATPSSANFAAVVTDETGSGAVVLGTSPTFTTDITAPTVYGGSAASGNLILQSTSNGTRGNIQTPDLTVLGTSSQAFGTSTGVFVDVGTGNCNVTTGAIIAMRMQNTVTAKGNSATTFAALFNAQYTVTDDGTARTLGPSLNFPSQNTFTATIASGLTVNDLAGIPAYVGLYYTLTLNRTGSGTGTMQSAAGLYISTLASIGTGWTITNYHGMLIDIPGTITGTITNFYGVKNNGANATGRWFLYETGGMKSSHKGQLRIGDNTAPGKDLDLLNDSAQKPGVGGLWTVASDERLKTNIQPADLDQCYNAVKNIPLKRFMWRDDCYSQESIKDRTVVGWIAQDVKPVFPKAVGAHRFVKPNQEAIEDCLDLNSGQLIAALYGAVQKLQRIVEETNGLNHN